MSFFPPPPAHLRQHRQSGLAGSADAWYLAERAQAVPLLVVCATALDAQRVTDEARWFDPTLKTALLPDWETLPYDSFSPHPDLVSERLATLYQLSRGELDLVAVPLSTALYRLAPPAYLAAYTFFLKQGEKFEESAFRAQMALGGYSHVSQVYAPGEFSVRGGVIDLFPMGSALPYRLDLFDDEIETIRAFDVDSQRSIYPVKDIRLLPAREFPLDDAGVAHFRQAFRATFEGDPSKCKLYKDVSNKLAPAGVEYYLPLFFEATATLFDYLPEQAAIAGVGDLDEAAQRFWDNTRGRYQLLGGDPDRPLLAPQALFLDAEEFFAQLAHRPRLTLAAEGAGPTCALPELVVDRRAATPLERLAAYVARPGKTLILAPGEGRRETLREFLAEHGLSARLAESWQDFLAHDALVQLGVGPLAVGFQSTDGRLGVVTETELYALPPRPRRAREARATDAEGLLRDLSELKIGDPVVHSQHGVGRYQGLVTMDLGEGPTEFLQLEYANADKLYVPVSQLQVIARYSGAEPDAAPLHRLGTEQWEKARRRAMQAARDTAAELLALYAQRAARQGHAFRFAELDYQRFAEGFGFVETPDQAAAIAAVLKDMATGKPMDRLICGDVGFGKTEVALRAAFVAVMGGKQVAVLVPTTLLAEQHYQNFIERFSGWPIRIAELSRFRTAKEQAEVLDGLKKGTIDIVIGTHRLIQKDVKFARLGLVTIDEEHRFGVRQKEQLKALRAEVDVLTLTATPIPRTLAMSLEGIRDFSVIATAPLKRLAVKTFVRPYGQGLIREAVLRELKRGGQVYFLHNEVESIYAMQERLTQLLPEARIHVGHGQMPERELEHVMRDFYQQRFDLLLCTTIIETGIDVPSANTIIINRADKFGLAQLHQLRGRVGRSHHQAFAYLLVPEGAKLTAQAHKRLEAIQLMEDLGAGFHLAMHDLEIRGAGEVLGEKQSGDMLEVGFALYNDMLATAVDSLRQGREPDLGQPLGVVSEINLHLPALLPETYCNDVHERLVIYKRLANCGRTEDVDALAEELIDRFGHLPEPTRALLETHRLRLAAKPLGVAKLDAGPDAIVVQLAPQAPVDAGRIIHLLQSRRDMRLAGQDRLRWNTPSPDLASRVDNARRLFKEIG